MIIKETFCPKSKYKGMVSNIDYNHVTFEDFNTLSYFNHPALSWEKANVFVGTLTDENGFRIWIPVLDKSEWFLLPSFSLHFVLSPEACSQPVSIPVMQPLLAILTRLLLHRWRDESTCHKSEQALTFFYHFGKTWWTLGVRFHNESSLPSSFPDPTVWKTEWMHTPALPGTQLRSASVYDFTDSDLWF